MFVADSQRHRWDENIESMQDMHANLAEHGVQARALPLVLQYNKQDLPPSLLATVPELSEALNFRNVPELPADALSGRGVFDTLRALGVIVLRRLGASAPAATPTSNAAQSGGHSVVQPNERSLASPVAQSPAQAVQQKPNHESLMEAAATSGADQ